MRRLCWLLILVIAALLAPVTVASAQSTPPISDADRAFLGLEVVTEPEKLDRLEFRHVQEMRRHYGLRHDAAFVRSLHADPARYGGLRSAKGLFANLIVTPGEIPRLRVRADLEWQTQAAGPIRDLLGESEAGMFLNSHNHFVVQCARCATAAVSAQIAHLDLPSPLRDAIVVRKVRYSTEDLRVLERRINAALGDARVSTVGDGVYPMRNRVVIGIGRRAKPRAQRVLAGQFPRRAFAFDLIPAPAERPGGGVAKLGRPTSFDVARTIGHRGILVTFTGAAEVTDPKDPCQYDYVASAVERDDEVLVAVRPKLRAVHLDPHFCDLVGHGRSVHVTLHRPFGGRRLIDAATDDAVPVFDGSTLLKPTWLPPAWESAGEGGINSETFGFTWGRSYRAPGNPDPHTCTDVPGSVWLAQGPLPPPDLPLYDPAAVVDVIDVRGHPATRTFDSRSGSTSIRWLEPGGAVVLDGYSACAGASGVDLDTLTRIAQGLR